MTDEISVADAFEMTKAGAQSLIAGWAQNVTQEQLDEVDAIVNKGGRVVVQVDGGLHGEPFRITGYLLDLNGNEVHRLFALPGASGIGH